MWRKSEDGKPVPGASSSPDSSVQYAGAAAASNSSSGPVTLSQRIKIKGEISGQGDFFVDGELEGKVRISDGTFTVGPNARVTAEVEARQIIVRGEIIGSLKALERIQILSTAKVTGNMDAHGIVIEEGAELHSKIATPRAAAAASQPAARETRSPEVAQSRAESKKDEPVPAQRPESSPQAKGAAVGSPSQPDSQKN
jgi:cytoskeletal protein CcmA (bactofilin family)